MAIHPTAQVDSKAEIGRDVEIGPYCVVGPKVVLGDRTRLYNHVTILGPTTLGTDNHIFPHAVLGTPPQDFKFRGSDTVLIVGNRNVIREGVTINRGTEVAGGKTVVGDNNLLMAYAHIAHDCLLENNIVLANNTILGGHIKIESDAGISGGCALHHFVTVGEKAYIGGMSQVRQDIPPFMLSEGGPARVLCVNTIGLRRRGFSEEAILALKQAHHVIWRSGHPRSESFTALERNGHCTPEVLKLIAFLRASATGKQGRAREALRTW